jgi:CHAD domain-containing protein
MKSTRKHLHQPVELTCRQFAMVLLANAVKECDGLSEPENTAALHDFRVSVRRLRTFLKSYQAYLPKTVCRRSRKQLRELMSATNTWRDSQVQLAWLEQQFSRKNLGRLQRQGLSVVIRQLREQQDDAMEDLVGTIPEDFGKIRERLEKGLATAKQAIQLNSSGELESFASVTARMLQQHAAKLRDALDQVQSVDGRSEAHRARLASKHLRYVLEPVRSLVAGGGSAVNKLKNLQDLLGNLRDLQNLELMVRSILKRTAVAWSERLADLSASKEATQTTARKVPELDECRALAAVIQKVRRRERRLFVSLEQQWLGGAQPPFFDRIDRITLQLDPSLQLVTSRGGALDRGPASPSEV